TDGRDESFARGRLSQGRPGRARERAGTMIALAAENLADLRRWTISAAIVVLAHGAIVPGPKQEMVEAEPEQKLEQRPVEEPPPEVKPAQDPEPCWSGRSCSRR